MYYLFIGNVSCLANHHSEFGVTDALCKHGNYLLSSAYDYDNGTGYLNGKLSYSSYVPTAFFDFEKTYCKSKHAYHHIGNDNIFYSFNPSSLGKSN